MSATYNVRIRTIGNASPETAAVRLMALLPKQWSANLLGCTKTARALTITPPDRSSSTEVASVVDELLTNSVLHEWVRDGVVSRHIGES